MRWLSVQVLLAGGMGLAAAWASAQSFPTKPIRSLTISSPLVLVVHPALPVQSVKELIALAKSLNRPESREKLFRAGVEVVASTPEQPVATMKSEMTRMGKVIKDAGIRDLPGFESTSLSGIFALAQTPAAIINRLNQNMAQVLNAAEVKEKFLNNGMEIVASSPQEFAATMNADMTAI